MKRIALLVLPLFILTACEQGLPTAAEIADDALTASIVSPNDELTPTNVNLATSTTIQLVVPGVTLVPTNNLVVTSTGFEDSDEHEFAADCPAHFQDGDLYLHFEVATLFPYTSADEMETGVIELALTYTLLDEPIDGGTYYVQLVWNEPKGHPGGR